jgi:CRISPR-associated protein Csa3
MALMTSEEKHKSFIITLGWTESPALTSLTKHGLAEGDTIILLTPDWRDEGVMATISNLKAIVGNISQKIVLEELPVPIARFEEAVGVILKRLSKERAEGRKLIVNLSGGMRILIIEALIAVMTSGVKDTIIEVQSEDKRMTVEIPYLWEYTPSLSHPQMTILKALINKPSSVSELAKIHGLPLSTTYRLILKLEGTGLIITEKVGRERVSRPTLRGKLVARIEPNAFNRE